MSATVRLVGRQVWVIFRRRAPSPVTAAYPQPMSEECARPADAPAATLGGPAAPMTTVKSYALIDTFQHHPG
jgi:hypothetical protein